MANLIGTVNLGLQDAFEDYMDRAARELQGEWFDGKVSGITYRNADGASRQDVARTLKTFDELTLQPEPDNPFDKHAVAVYTPAGLQVGYLEGRMAAEVCRVLKRGGQSKCFVRSLRERGDICGVSFGLISVPGKNVRT